MHTLVILKFRFFIRENDGSITSFACVSSSTYVMTAGSLEILPSFSISYAFRRYVPAPSVALLDRNTERLLSVTLERR